MITPAQNRYPPGPPLTLPDGIADAIVEWALGTKPVDPAPWAAIGTAIDEHVAEKVAEAVRGKEGR